MITRPTMSLDEVQRLKRDHFAAICAASDCGGLSAVEAADLALRTQGRLLDELEARCMAERELRSALALV